MGEHQPAVPGTAESVNDSILGREFHTPLNSIATRFMPRNTILRCQPVVGILLILRSRAGDTLFCYCNAFPFEGSNYL